MEEAAQTKWIANLGWLILPVDCREVYVLMEMYTRTRKRKPKYFTLFVIFRFDVALCCQN